MFFLLKIFNVLILHTRRNHIKSHYPVSQAANTSSETKMTHVVYPNWTLKGLIKKHNLGNSNLERIGAQLPECVRTELPSSVHGEDGGSRRMNDRAARVRGWGLRSPQHAHHAVSETTGSWLTVNSCLLTTAVTSDREHTGRLATHQNKRVAHGWNAYTTSSTVLAPLH